MKTRGFILLVLALLATVVVLGGCKKKSESAPSPEAPKAEDVTKTTEAAAEQAEEAVTAAAEETKEAATEAAKGVKEAAAETAEKAGEAVAQATGQVEQTTCPVMDGNPIDKNVFVEYKGKKVYFCCEACKAKFVADPEKYLGNLPQFKQELEEKAKQATEKAAEEVEKTTEKAPELQ
jgi:YHS domain-containing protein/Na+-transporting methylmalonyl-CoA/oxaloacetate decarboxylase gamma subunit